MASTAYVALVGLPGGLILAFFGFLFSLRCASRLPIVLSSSWLFLPSTYSKIDVDRCQQVCHIGFVSQTLYTTVEVAKMTRIPRATLQHWIATRKISAPRVKLVKGRAVRLWNSAQIEKARDLKGTLKPGPKP